MSPIRDSGLLHPQIREEAVEWFLAFCEEDVDPAACKQFNAWLRRSPEHVRGYLRISAFWEDAEDLKRHTQYGIDELVQRALAESNVVALDSKAVPEPPRVPRRTPRLRWALWPVAACLLAGVLVWLNADRTRTYATAAAEQQTFVLSDGSAVQLNARSRVAVHYTGPRREVNLIQGQALFRVAKDPSRPFLVYSAGAVIRAVGTQFDVLRKRDTTVVTVVEGQVAVSDMRSTGKSGDFPAAPPPASLERMPVLVSAGQRVVAGAQVLEPPRTTDAAAATAWTEGRLVFDSVRLDDALEEFNRYLPRPLVLESPQLLSMHVSGVFSVTEPRQFLEFLHRRFGTTSEETDGEVRITPP
jgi:transmembrane sensor